MLSVLLWSLAIIACVLGGLLLALLVVPLQFRAEGIVDAGEVSGELRARWGFGLVGVRLSSRRSSGLTLCGLRVAKFSKGGDESDEKKRARREKKKEKKAARAKRPGGRRGARWALAHRAALQRVMGRVLATIAPELEVSGRLGLGDPVDTALAELVLGELRRIPSIELGIAWDYLDDIIELEAQARARIWLLHIVGVALALLLGDREVRALLRAPA